MSPIAVFLVVTLVSLDSVMPTMYSVFSADKGSVSADGGRSSSYKRISFPRTMFLAAFICLVIFAPTGAENSGFYLAAFVLIAIAYIISVIVDVRRSRISGPKC